MIDYIETYLLDEFKEVESSERANELPEIDFYEKTLIYKYSCNGYEKLNQSLLKNNGLNDSSFGMFLEKALKKLPSYNDIVYRGAILPPFVKQKYETALANDLEVLENTFLSASKSRMIAADFGTTLFRIISKNGKDIEKISKFGIHGVPNEHEVLFKPNTRFKVLSIKDNLITLEEI